MKLFGEKYSYETIDLNQSQYDGIDLKAESYVTARYTKSEISAYQGNPFIEALPPLMDRETCRYTYTSILPDYNFVKQKNATIEERIAQLAQLQSLRLPLPFHYDLEVRFHEALVSSYANRYQLCNPDRILADDHGVIPILPTSILVAEEAAPVSSGFALLGSSGCGKSTAIQQLTSRYPQVILHEHTTGQMTQISYLIVNCPPNSNFNALYMNIGIAIDRALGITSRTYENKIMAKRSLGEKSTYIRTLIENFAIGAILFDEIQLINFDANKDNSFESLLTLSNQTKVAICVIGTQDAYEKMFPNLRTTRRIGSIIEASAYCKHQNFFSYLVSTIVKYQWFDEQMTLNTPEIVQSLFQNTNGIINQLITLYQTIQYDYLKTSPKNRKSITPESIRELIDSYFPGYQRFLIMPDSIKKEEQRRTYGKQIASMIHAQDPALQENFMDTIMHAPPDNFELCQNVIQNIQNCYDCYNVKTIENAFYQIISRPKYKSADERQLTQGVLKHLSSRASDARPKKIKATSTLKDIQTSLMTNVKPTT